MTEAGCQAHVTALRRLVVLILTLRSRLVKAAD